MNHVRVDYVVDISMPPLLPPGRSIYEGFFSQQETDISVYNGMMWNKYILEYSIQLDRERGRKIKKFNKFGGDNGGYIALNVTLSSSKIIEEAFEVYGIDGIIEDLHLTLMYDESEPNMSANPIDYEYTQDVIDIILLGDVDSEWRAIALVLEKKALEVRHNELKNMGFTHSYDEFIAHVSIKYKPTEIDIDLIMNNKSSIINSIGEVSLYDEHQEIIKRTENEN